MYKYILFNFVLELLLDTGEERQEMDKITCSSKVYDFLCCEPKIKGFTRLSTNKINPAMAQTKIFSKIKSLAKL